MNTKEQPAAHDHLPSIQLRTPFHESTLNRGQVEIGQKSFNFALKKNAGGRFLRITERMGNAHVSLVIPDSGLAIFQQALGKMFRTANGPLPPPAANSVAGHVLKTEQVQIEKKKFAFKLWEHPRGRYVSITENSGGHCNEIVIPTDGIETFGSLLDAMADTLSGPRETDPAGVNARPEASVVEEPLKLGQMRLNRRVVTFALKKNLHGRFLRITTEENEGRYNSLIIPSEGLEEFKNWVVEMAEISKALGD
jgi:hypothetical protein